MSGATGLGLYRIAQESLADIVKHAPGAADDVGLNVTVGGIEATRRLRAGEHAPPVLVLTTYRTAPPAGGDGRHVAQRLTERELDVLTLIGRGRTNSEIAQPLCVSDVTVKSHIGHIFAKLDLRDRAAAIVYAFDQGMVTPGETTE